MIRALVFDFDGLIIDTESPILQSWVELFESFGFPLSLDVWATTIGTADAEFQPDSALEKLVGHALDWEQIEPQRRRREMELVDAQPILPGVVQTLQDARRLGLKLGLASSSSCRWVMGHLSQRGLLPYFDALRASDDVRFTKPDPELYLSTLAELGVQPAQAVALEDSPNGIRAAKAAGMLCVAIPGPLTKNLPLDEADLRLDSLADMPLENLLRVISGR